MSWSNCDHPGPVVKQFTFRVILGILLLVVTLAGLEAVAGLFAPSWPYRDLRSVAPYSLERERNILSYHTRWWSPINSWGMRDLERRVQKPNGSMRIVFIGDSFLEGEFTHYPLSLLVEKHLFMSGTSSFETINLGVSATNPKSYFFRLKDIGFNLNPDLTFVFFYSGNDFMSAEDIFQENPFSALIDERPKPSLLGMIAPRLTWLLVNRFGVSEFLRGSQSIPGEFDALFKATQLPYQQGLHRVVEHVHRFYFPDVDETRISSILGRGGPLFWESLEFREAEPEFLQGWIIKSLLVWETQTGEYAKSSADADKMLSQNDIDATVTWLHAMNDAAERNGSKLVLFLIPVGTVDPSYVDYWKPWSRYFSWNYISDARHLRLTRRLKDEGLTFVDLRETLGGMPHTYRKTDGHWTEKGHHVVAVRVLQEIEKFYPGIKGEH